MIIPHDQLDPHTLNAVIEEFVTRHGAVHGHGETTLERMVQTVLQQLHSGRVVIVYDQEGETCSIMSKQEARQAGEQSEPHEALDQPEIETADD